MSASAQIQKDSLQKVYDDSVKFVTLQSRLVYPLIKAGTWSGVIPLSNPDEIPDPTIDYKLLFELTANNKDTTVKDINNGITEICRIINLHVASGIPVSKIKPVVVVHGAALYSFYSNKNFKEKYKAENPNLTVIEELIKKTGAKFIACSQAMNYFEVKKDEMIPSVKVSLTAQTALSSYELKGYKLYVIKDEGK